jgi:hypothetical protein
MGWRANGYNLANDNCATFANQMSSALPWREKRHSCIIVFQIYVYTTAHSKKYPPAFFFGMGSNFSHFSLFIPVLK